MNGVNSIFNFITLTFIILTIFSFTYFRYLEKLKNIVQQLNETDINDSTRDMIKELSVQTQKFVEIQLSRRIIGHILIIGLIIVYLLYFNVISIDFHF